MELSPVFRQVFGRLAGQPCWNVKRGHGLFLTTEFGRPRLEVVEPRPVEGETSAKLRRHYASRRVYLHGEWHLWIYCCEWSAYRGGAKSSQ